MGGSDKKGDGLGRAVPGQSLLNRHQVGGVSCSPDGLFAQQERESIRGRPAVGERDIWWTAGTARGGTGHLGLAHRNTARQATDGLWTEARGQQKQSNDPGNNQHILNTPIIGRR